MHDNRTVAAAHEDAALLARLDLTLDAECDREAALALIGGEAPPDVAIVDLGAAEAATEAFLIEARPLAADGRPLLAAFTEDFSGPSRRRLLEAGADAVFERARRPTDFARETHALHRYWRRMVGEGGAGG